MSEPMMTQKQRELIARIDQQIESGQRLRLYTLPINPEDYRTPKHAQGWLTVELITEAEEWSEYTIEYVELFKPFYRAKDWKSEGMVYAMPDERWQHYKDLLHSSVKSLEDLRDGLKVLFQ